MTNHRIAVSFTNADNLLEAQTLAKQLGMTLINDLRSDAAAYEYLLILTPDYLGLQKTTAGKSDPLHIDFLSGKMLYRQKHAGLRKELIARAMGMNPRDNPSILDATAGLGRDSFILASLGYEITLLERSDSMHALLNDAIERAKKNNRIAPVVDRMHLIHADSIEWLQGHQHQFDVIYLDPMFPERQKSASVKKEMVILQELLGKDTDCDKLFEPGFNLCNPPCCGKKTSFGCQYHGHVRQTFP